MHENNMSSSSMPPLPPSDINKGDGKFLYVKDLWSRSMLQNAFAAIKMSEGWDYVKGGPGDTGFMFSSHPMNNKIMTNMEICEPYVGHSGASYGCIMREMQFLATYGITEHKKRYL